MVFKNLKARKADEEHASRYQGGAYIETEVANISRRRTRFVGKNIIVTGHAKRLVRSGDSVIFELVEKLGATDPNPLIAKIGKDYVDTPIFKKGSALRYGDRLMLKGSVVKEHGEVIIRVKDFSIE